MTTTVVINTSTLLVVTYTLMISVLISTAEGEPTMDDIVNYKCPSERPFKCLPFGACCGGDQYCYNGDCQRCFPREVADKDLLFWCQTKGIHNTSLMNDATCSLACQARFTVQQLVNKPCTDQGFDVDVPSDKSSDDDQWYHRFMAMCIVSVLLCCSTITFLSLLCYTMFGNRWLRPRHRTHEEGLSERLHRRRSRRGDDLNEDGTVRYSECAPNITAFNQTYGQCPTDSVYDQERGANS